MPNPRLDILGRPSDVQPHKRQDRMREGQRRSNSDDLVGAELPQDVAGPLYEALADFIRGKVYAHQWSTSSRIPSEHELMDAFGLSRGTVWRAIKVLVDEGLVIQEHGRGTFVSEGGLSHPSGVRPLSFAASLREQGKDFKTYVLCNQVMPAPLDITNCLQLPQGTPLLFLRRVRTVEGAPVLCQESWMNIVACPGLDEADYTRESAFDAVERCSGLRIVRSTMSYSARIAGSEHGAYLRCDKNAPVMTVNQLIRVEDGTPIERSVTWLPAGQAIVGDAVQSR